jgi:parallel beta-helix repeat protein
VGVSLHDNVLSYGLNNAIEVWCLNAATIARNAVTNNSGGIELWGKITNSTLSRNRFTNNTLGATATASANAGRGLWATTNAQSAPNTGNHSDNTVAYNIFDTSTARGALMAQGTGWLVYNNTFYKTTGASSTVLDIEGSGTTATVSNNLIYQPNDTAASWEAVFGVNAAEITLAGNNNLFFMGDGDLAIRYNGTTYTTTANFATWKTASGQTASIKVDPLFTAASNGDYRLLSGSPAIDAGADVSLTSDCMGYTLEGLPDIGAYEALRGGKARRFPETYFNVTTVGGVTAYDNRH